MTIGTVTVDRRLRLSCPYGHGILTIPLGRILVTLRWTPDPRLAYPKPS